MRNYLVLISVFFSINLVYAQDWQDIPVPPSPGEGMVWELQPDVSDDFNYEFNATSSAARFGEGNKWVNWYHNTWTGPLPTIWRRDHVQIEDGILKIRSSRPAGDSTTLSGQKYPITNTGCVSSSTQIQYPVYIESSAKVMNSVMACAVWLLSPDDTKEIDFVESYGHDTRWTNPWFNNQRIHVSHHVFIRNPFQDWQPHDEGSFYTDGSTVWNQDFHRYGVYWRDPWHIEYYIDGKLVRTRSGKDQIDPLHYTNVVSPGNPNIDSREGLEDPMDIIIDIEDQTWRALQGLSPTDEELANEPEKNTFQVDWVRIYKPVAGEVGEVSAVSLDKTEVDTYVGANFTLTETITPNNALDLAVVWASDNTDVATVSQNGEVETHAEGVANITVTTNQNNKTATCKVTVEGTFVAASLDFDDESTYLDGEFEVGSELKVTADFHAGSGNTVANGVKFWLREIKPGWSVANDYTFTDNSVTGQESGTATGIISLDGVPTTAEIPSENWYFLYMTMLLSDGQTLDKGIYPINITSAITTNTTDLEIDRQLEIFPNPAHSMLNIERPSNQSDFKLELYDVSGKLIVPTLTNNGTLLQVDISELTKGTYFVKLISDKVYSSSFVKL